MKKFKNFMEEKYLGADPELVDYPWKGESDRLQVEEFEINKVYDLTDLDINHLIKKCSEDKEIISSLKIFYERVNEDNEEDRDEDGELLKWEMDEFIEFANLVNNNIIEYLYNVSEIQLALIEKDPDNIKEIVKYANNISKSSQEFIFDKYPEYIKDIKNVDPKLATKNSHKILGSKFDVFNEE